MSVQFDKWLAQPSTLCFLRRLVSAEIALHVSGTPVILRRAGRPTAACHQQESQPQTSRRHAYDVDRALSLKRQERGVKVAKQQQDTIHTSHRERMDQEFDRLYDRGPMRRPQLKQAHISQEKPVTTRIRTKTVPTRGTSSEVLEQQEIDAWIAKLSQADKERGRPGVLESWQDLRQKRWMLPLSGDEAVEAWQKLLGAAVDEREVRTPLATTVLDDMYTYIRLARKYSKTSDLALHRIVVGGLLGSSRADTPHTASPNVAIWHKRLVEDGFATDHDLVDVVQDVRSDIAFEEFRMAYERGSDRSLYGPCMKAVREHHGDEAASKWHEMFAHNDDIPLQLSMSEPSPPPSSTTYRRDTRLSGPNSKRTAPRGPGTRYKQSDEADLKTELIAAAKVDDRQISDGFCARIIATKMFSIELIIKCLQFFNVELLGPIATRELACRADTPEALMHIFDTTAKAGYLDSNMMFVRLLQRLAINSDDRSFHLVLQSDQHPDEYENVDLQRLLFQTSINQHDIPRAYIAFTALVLHSPTKSHEIYLSMLQAAAEQRDVGQVESLIAEMRAKRIEVDEATIKKIWDNLLSWRAPGKGVPREVQSIRALHVLTEALVYYAKNDGGEQWIPPIMWEELLKRYGFTQQIDELERLVVWLSDFYAIRGFGVSRLKNEKRNRYRHYIFQREMMKAIVIWAWRKAAHGDVIRSESATKDDIARMPSVLPGSCQAWARGIQIVKYLHAEHIEMAEDAARNGVVQQLWTTFGPGYSSRPINHLVRSRSKLNLIQFLTHVEELWPGLMQIDQKLIDGGAETYPELLVALFGNEKKQVGSRDDMIDIAAWATTQRIRPGDED